MKPKKEIVYFCRLFLFLFVRFRQSFYDSNSRMNLNIRILEKIQMTIYLDIVFFENVVMNFLIILATAIISKVKINPPRMLLASSIGGVFSILTYIIKLTNFQSLILKIAISVIIVKISYHSKKLKYLVKNLMLFYLVSLTFGGAAFMLLYFVHPENIISKDGILVGTYPLRITLIGAFLGLILIRISCKNNQRSNEQKRNAL